MSPSALGQFIPLFFITGDILPVCQVFLCFVSAAVLPQRGLTGSAACHGHQQSQTFITYPSQSRDDARILFGFLTFLTSPQGLAAIINDLT